MYIHYSTGNNLGPRNLVRIVEVSVIGGVHFRRFHCTYHQQKARSAETYRLVARVRPRTG